MIRKNKLNNICVGAILFLMTGLTLTGSAYAHDALFLGLTDSRGEPAHPHFEQAIRHELAVNPRVNLVSDVETQRVIREMERRGRGRAEAFIPAGARVGDSVVIFRGVVEETVLEVKRHVLAWGKISARMTVSFYFNETAGPAVDKGEFSEKALQRNDLLNSGSTLKLTFSASESKAKDLLLFASAKKTVHISAADRSELIGKMQSKIIKDVSEFAAHYFNALATGPVHKRAAEVVDSADTSDSPAGVEAQDSSEAFPGAPELMGEQ